MSTPASFTCHHPLILREHWADQPESLCRLCGALVPRPVMDPANVDILTRGELVVVMSLVEQMQPTSRN